MALIPEDTILKVLWVNYYKFFHRQQVKQLSKLGGTSTTLQFSLVIRMRLARLITTNNTPRRGGRLLAFILKSRRVENSE